MKKISLILSMTVMILTVQLAHAQVADTTKNRIEVKKKVKTGVHGRQVTKIKVEGKGSPGAISEAANRAATDKTSAPVAVTPPATPAVVVVEPQASVKPDPTTTSVTTTTETRPVPVKTTSSTSVHHTTTSSHVVHHTGTATHKAVKKPVAASGTKTTTTTTVKKSTN